MFYITTFDEEEDEDDLLLRSAVLLPSSPPSAFRTQWSSHLVWSRTAHGVGAAEPSLTLFPPSIIYFTGSPSCCARVAVPPEDRLPLSRPCQLTRPSVLTPLGEDSCLLPWVLGVSGVPGVPLCGGFQGRPAFRWRHLV